VEKRQLVEKDNEEITVARQCELLNLPRSSFYYSSTVNDDCNLELMRLIDEQFTRAPFHGVRRMTAWLRTQGYEVNLKRVRRLFRRLGLQAIYPRRRIGFSSQGHKLYPYISNIIRSVKPGRVWGIIFSFTTQRGCIGAYAIERHMRSILEVLQPQIRLRQGHEMVKISRNRQVKSAPYISPFSVQTTGGTSEVIY